VRDAVVQVVGQYELKLSPLRSRLNLWGEIDPQQGHRLSTNESIYVITTDGKARCAPASPRPSAVGRTIKETSVHFSANTPFFAGSSQVFTVGPLALLHL